MSEPQQRNLTAEFPNKFALMLFCPNVWGGITATLSPNRWEATWVNNQELAILAEHAGLEALIPLGNWLGFGGNAETSTYSFETITWAAGLLSVTKRILIFATVHAPFVHPVLAAKQAATCSHIGEGRFALNVVSGGNPLEFELFGVPMLDHDERYQETAEWLEIVKRAWAEANPFDFHGRYFNLKHVISRPPPYGELRPILVSAGSSPAGRRFAVENADCLFMLIPEVESLEHEVTGIRRSATGPLKVFSSGTVFCKPTNGETEAYYDHLVFETPDKSVSDYLEKAYRSGGSQSVPTEFIEDPVLLATMRERFIASSGVHIVKGDPDEVAQQFKVLSDAGIDGMAFSLPNFLEDFPVIRDEVIPRMEELGLRVPN